MKVEEDKSILRMEGVSKSFPGVQALQDVQFDLRPGEVHCLIGENGAGKTTLMNILNGVLSPDSGKIFLFGEERDVVSPDQAQELGISFVHQELNLVPPLSVMENVVIGHAPVRLGNTFIDWKKTAQNVSKVINRLDLEVDLEEPVENLSIAQQQLIEIAKALYLDAKIIVMDEPTSSLNEEEVERLFGIIKDLKSTGHSIIFISHRLEEIFQIGDRATVLRNGKYVGFRELANTDRDQLVSMMVGQELGEQDLYRKTRVDKPLYEVKDLILAGKVRDYSFSLYEGEILGLAGLQGSGRTELLEGLFGDRVIEAGQIYLEGEQITVEAPRDALEKGIAYLPDDRKRKGLFLNQPISANISSASLAKDARFGILDLKKQASNIKQMIEEFGIESSGIDQQIKHLSGGNKQKSILAKCLRSEPRVILMNEPTRGIDVGAKAEVYQLMNKLTQSSKVGIIVVSSELPELIDISDRIMVIFEGKLNGIYPHHEADKEKLMEAMTGG